MLFMSQGVRDRVALPLLYENGTGGRPVLVWLRNVNGL